MATLGKVDIVSLLLNRPILMTVPVMLFRKGLVMACPCVLELLCRRGLVNICACVLVQERFCYRLFLCSCVGEGYQRSVLVFLCRRGLVTVCSFFSCVGYWCLCCCACVCSCSCACACAGACVLVKERFCDWMCLCSCEGEV